jgi:hypothetical protein
VQYLYHTHLRLVQHEQSKFQHCLQSRLPILLFLTVQQFLQRAFHEEFFFIWTHYIVFLYFVSISFGLSPTTFL